MGGDECWTSELSPDSTTPSQDDRPVARDAEPPEGGLALAIAGEHGRSARSAEPAKRMCGGQPLEQMRIVAGDGWCRRIDLALCPGQLENASTVPGSWNCSAMAMASLAGLGEGRGEGDDDRRAAGIEAERGGGG